LRRSSLALFAALPALALAAAAHAQPTTITVQMDEYKYTPARIELHVGQPYVFHVTNTGGKQHDLNAKAFFAAVTLAPASVPLVHGGGVELDQGASADIAFTPTKPGTYEMHCTEPLHSMLGMHGQIVVQ
jgi:uncharacterized cupredoxin-like copper-binding protein